MRTITRLLKGTFWNLVVTLLGIAFYELAPLRNEQLWLGLIVLCGVEWIIIAKLRERLRF